LLLLPATSPLPTACPTDAGSCRIDRGILRSELMPKLAVSFGRSFRSIFRVVLSVVPTIFDPGTFLTSPSGDSLNAKLRKWVPRTTVRQRRQVTACVFSRCYLLQVIRSNTVCVFASGPDMINLHTWSNEPYPEFISISVGRNSNWLTCNLEREVTVPTTSVIDLPLPTPTSIFVTLVNLHDEAVRGSQYVSSHTVMISPFERR
jgi:hypothetical protein